MKNKKDQGYAWVALAAMLFLNIIYASSFSTLGIFIVEFISYFRTSKATVTWIGAVNMFVGSISALCAGPLLKKLGCRTVIIISALLLFVSCVVSGWFGNLLVLFIFFGVLSGVGFLFLHIAALASIQFWFEKRRALANSIFMTGQSVGVLIWPPIVRGLCDLYTWKGAFIVVGALYLNALISAMLLCKSPESPQTEAVNTKDSKIQTLPSVNQHIRTKLLEFGPLACYCLGLVLLQLGHMNLLVYTPLRAEELHIPHQKAALLISIIGIFGIVCPLVGWIGDRKRINRTIMLGILDSLAGVVGMISTQLKHFSTLLVASLVFGMLSAGYNAILGAVLVDVAGMANIELASGLYAASLGIGSVLLHATAGPILDLTGNSNTLFWIFSSCQFIGGILIMTIPFWKSRRVKISQNIENDMEITILPPNKD